MLIPTSLLLLVLAHTAPMVDAFPPHKSLLYAAERMHKFARRRGASLARDLRIVFQGIKSDSNSSSRRVMCVRPSDPFAALQGSSTSSISASSSFSAGGTTSTTRAPLPSGTSIYKLVESYSGSKFFEGWSFFEFPDPTNGIVDYVGQTDAQTDGLAYVTSSGTAVMKVDTTPVITGNRKSVRITTETSFTQGVWVLDATHMPQGCGTWPSFWSNGPNRPAGGEIDIVEGVNDDTVNQVTLHTASGCTLPNGATSSSVGISGSVVGTTNCATLETDNAGCGIRSNASSSYGSGFNSIGGGVYALLWDNDGISVWFFPRNSIPPDVAAEVPQPTTWGTPMARWPASSCSPTKYFYNHSIIFDITLCGDWAGTAWTSSGVTGQEQSCASRTGVATCEDFVRNNGASFSEAYWEIVSVKIYQTKRQT